MPWVHQSQPQAVFSLSSIFRLPHFSYCLLDWQFVSSQLRFFIHMTSFHHHFSIASVFWYSLAPISRFRGDSIVFCVHFDATLSFIFYPLHFFARALFCLSQPVDLFLIDLKPFNFFPLAIVLVAFSSHLDVSWSSGVFPQHIVVLALSCLLQPSFFLADVCLQLASFLADVYLQLTFFLVDVYRQLAFFLINVYQLPSIFRLDAY